MGDSSLQLQTIQDHDDATKNNLDSEVFFQESGSLGKKPRRNLFSRLANLPDKRTFVLITSVNISSLAILQNILHKNICMKLGATETRAH